MTSRPAQPEKQQLILNIPEDLAPVYVNLARITHSPSEMVLDFALMVPGGTPGPANVKTRVLMSPLSAKLFYSALGENLSKFEAKFGEINIPGGSSLAENLFRPPQK
ncbi:MAG: DUF3467 domain-containing protein [Anaerolineales bacterium]|nr:DUF3467 domain-containing protein [Chloroflexota bacterium]MBL7163899.1 DUF3467 domain-containing protein [Anaerolineales bacterium]